MNIFTILIGLYICFKGLIKFLDSFFLSKDNVNIEDISEPLKLNKFNYYSGKVNQILTHLSDFFFGLFVLYVGAKFILIGVKGVSLIPLLRSILDLFIEASNLIS